jgi:hypothetical protein
MGTSTAYHLLSFNNLKLAVVEKDPSTRMPRLPFPWDFASVSLKENILISFMPKASVALKK